MASVNKVILIGNLGRDPETRYTPNGDAITTISIATSDSWKDKTTGEWKYLIRGKTVAADDLIVVGKLGLTDRLVIITVYSEGK